MSKVIVYAVENGKLYFGRPTLWSWFRVFFAKEALLTIKPIRGYESFMLYNPIWRISPHYAKFATYGLLTQNPLKAISYAEKFSPPAIKIKNSIFPLDKCQKV